MIRRRADGPSGVIAAEQGLGQSIDLTRAQAALSWELRAATELARLWRDQGRTAEARSLLSGGYDRFTEGHGTADLRTAKELLLALERG
jgi:predicted ATPase